MCPASFSSETRHFKQLLTGREHPKQKHVHADPGTGPRRLGQTGRKKKNDCSITKHLELETIMHLMKAYRTGIAYNLTPHS
jgi:hypothetical protein